MSLLAVGFIGIACVLLLLALRVPIAIALGGVSIVGIAIVRGTPAALVALGTLPYDLASSWTLSAVPMFLLMGSLAFHFKLTTGLFRAAEIFLARLPGGLAIATNTASAGFAAISGSSMAATAGMGRIAVPEMRRAGYDGGFACSVVAAAGTLGALIPPSIALIIYSWYAEVSVAKLLMAGVLPGILTLIVFSLMILFRTYRTPEIAPPSEVTFTRKEKIDAILDVWPLPVLVIAIIGGIYAGIITPTEAGAVGAALVIAIAILSGKFSWNGAKEGVRESLSITSNIFFIVIGAGLFTKFLILAGIPEFLTAFVEDNASSKIAFLLTITVIFLILGMFLEPIGVMLLTMPILLPICRAMGLDLIWFGIIVVKFIEVGVITPPIGLHAFVVKSIAGEDVPLGDIFKNLTWFLGAEAIIIGILMAFPAISTFLPSLI